VVGAYERLYTRSGMVVVERRGSSAELKSQRDLTVVTHGSQTRSVLSHDPVTSRSARQLKFSRLLSCLPLLPTTHCAPGSTPSSRPHHHACPARGTRRS
jgi:hypothetical protein